MQKSNIIRYCLSQTVLLQISLYFYKNHRFYKTKQVLHTGHILETPNILYGMNKKRHVLEILGQLEDEPPH